LNPELHAERAHAGAHWRWIDWPVRGVRAGYSLRTGGFSAAPYDAFNLGDHVGDRPEAVAANRRRLAETLGVRPVFLKQVHGWAVQALPSPDGSVADACWTDRRDTACCMMVADCLPILISDRLGRVVAAAHAGWRGLCGQQGHGVVEALLSNLRERHPDAQWLAWLGPCIGPATFEVGAEVRAAFCAADPQAGAHFSPLAGVPDKWWCDLPALARRRLVAQGVAQVFGNDGRLDWCTVSRPDLYFSHRRDRLSGRMAAAIFLA
jgi:polyphenol oxidase